MPDENSRDSLWYAQRLPSADVLQEVIDDQDRVDKLLNVARSRAIVIGGDDLLAKNSAEEAQVTAMLALATDAAKRLALDPATPLSDEEKDALDLFTILLARPAFLVRENQVFENPKNWPEIRKEKELLTDVIRGVGRIELADHFKIGTGFIVGDKRILTNNHVVASLVGVKATAWELNRKKFDKAVEAHNEIWDAAEEKRPWFDLRGELEPKEPSLVRVARILGCHKDVDMAVLELDAAPKNAERLTLATKEPAPFEKHRIYEVGHPTKDLGLKKAPLPILRRIFGQDETLGMKRLSPGTLMNWGNESKFHHDASTRAGSSGSCIVDFTGHGVVGLHYSGLYDERNNAIPLWKFQDDVLLTKNGVKFG